MHWPFSPVPKLHLGCAFLSNSSHPLYGGWWLHMDLLCIFLQFYRRWMELISKKSFARGGNLPETESNLLANLILCKKGFSFGDTHLVHPKYLHVWWKVKVWEAGKSAGFAVYHFVVCRLNPLMKFSLKVPTAKYCLLLPLELSALTMRDSSWKLSTFIQVVPLCLMDLEVPSRFCSIKLFLRSQKPFWFKIFSLHSKISFGAV